MIGVDFFLKSICVNAAGQKRASLFLKKSRCRVCCLCLHYIVEQRSLLRLYLAMMSLYYLNMLLGDGLLNSRAVFVPY